MSNGIDQAIYFVECDFGKRGKSFIEVDRDSNSRREIIENIVSGEYRDVVTVIECNPVERTSRDITEDIKAEALKMAFIQAGERLFADQIAFDRDHARDYRKHATAE